MLYKVKQSFIEEVNICWNWFSSNFLSVIFIKMGIKISH